MTTIFLNRNESKSKSKKGQRFIPKYYDFNLDSLQGQYKMFSINGQNKLYITPLVRTILENIKTLNKPGQESLCRYIKEKMDSNSRLLLKKGTSKSKIIIINGEQYIYVNLNIDRMNNNFLRIYNDNQYLQTTLI